MDVTVSAESPEIEKLQEQLRGEHDMYLRSLADFDNYRKRTEKDVANAVQRGKRTLILSFIEVVDSFDLALQQIAHASPSLVEGLQAVHRKTLALLETEGITPYASIGQKFNPELHEAIGSVVSIQETPGIVVDEAQRGYRAGDSIVRPARVRVTQQPTLN